MVAETERPRTPSRPVAKRLGSETLYGVLQVSPYAEEVVLRAAYLALARAHHPDVNNDPDAAERMRAINEAWELLSDPKRRAMYDLSLHPERSAAITQVQETSIRRATICWRCTENLGAYARYCSVCHWLLCVKCRGCGCQHPAWKARFQPRRRRMLALLFSGWAFAGLVSAAWAMTALSAALHAAPLP
jgi:hypothetical protein